MERTGIYHCQISIEKTPEVYGQELQFLCCACRLLMLYISMKFHENILKGFQVIERTHNDNCKISMGNNYKTVKTRVKVLVFYMSLMMFYISMKFHDKILRGFQVIELTQNYKSLL